METNKDKIKTISVARDFSRTPGARYKTDGPKSGEEFREEIIEPYFEKKYEDTIIEIDLDGVKGYTTSFLEEAFGGLVRKFGCDIVKQKVRIIANLRKAYKEKALEYIDEACEH